MTTSASWRRRVVVGVVGGAVFVVVAASVSGVLTTSTGPDKSLPPAAITSGSPSTGPAAAQSYPGGRSSYVVVPAGTQLAWTDLTTGTRGHFQPADGGGQVMEPSLSADGRRLAYVLLSGTHYALRVRNLDSHTGSTVDVASTVDSSARPSLSPDGTRIVYTAPSGVIYVASLVGGSITPTPVIDAGRSATWSGNAALAYIPAESAAPGGCAVELLALRMPAARCVLSTATLTAHPAPDGTPWTVEAVTGASSNELALVLSSGTAGVPGASAIAILDPEPGSTPLRLLRATVLNDSAKTLAWPVLIDHGTRVLYDQLSQASPTEGGTVLVATVDGGQPEVLTRGGGLGIGATTR